MSAKAMPEKSENYIYKLLSSQKDHTSKTISISIAGFSVTQKQINCTKISQQSHLKVFPQKF